MSGALQAVYQNQRSFGTGRGSCSFTTAGSFTWVAPAGITSVSAVAVGGGNGGSKKYFSCACYNIYSGPGGPGACLRYKNNYTVTPGNSYTVYVGAGGAGGTVANGTYPKGVASYFVSTSVLRARGDFTDGCSVGCGAGTGKAGGGGVQGNTRGAGGGGASGYGCGTNVSGVGQSSCGCASIAGLGGGGGGGGRGACACSGGAGGGGVGIFGQGSSGAGSSNGTGGIGGSGGSNGSAPSTINGGAGGTYGGGGGTSNGGSNPARTGGAGGVGAIRIVFPGNTRSFPSTCVGSP